MAGAGTSDGQQGYHESIRNEDEGIVGADDGDLESTMESLPWQEREHIREVVGNGHAVDDRALAELAARWARRAHRRASRIFTFVLGACVVIAAGVIAISNDDFDTVGAAFGAVLAISSVGLVIWAQLRPFRRADLANLAVINRSDGPPTREWSHWVLAWLVAWPIAGVVGIALRTLGIDVLSGPVGLMVFFGALWFVKRAIDHSESSP